MKSEKKVLIPGLGVAHSMGMGCTCNMMYGELLANPSTLLWLDKLCLPVGFSVSDDLYGPHVGYAIMSIFDVLGSEGILETISKETLLSTGKQLECLGRIVQEELHDLSLAAPDVVKQNKEGYEIEGDFFCKPYVVSGYASQFLAQKIGANCLVDKSFDKYLRFKNSLLSNWTKDKFTRILNAYNEVFSLDIVNDLALPRIIFTDKEWCKKCTKLEKCEASFKGEVRDAIQRLMELRSSDSFCLLRDEIDKIVEEHKGVDMLSGQEVVSELKARALKIYKKQKREFPRIKRWTNLAMIASIPSAFIAHVLGAEGMSAASAAIVAGAGVIDNYIKHEASKGAWINFLNKRTTPIEEC